MTTNRYSFVIILTYARSGSTLVQSILNSIPGYQIRGENLNALFHIYKCVEAVRIARNIHGWQPTMPDTPWFGADRLTPKLFKERMIATFVEGVLKPSGGATTIGFKEIRHTPFFMSDEEFSDYAQFILDEFPRSKIIVNSRYANEVANSAWLADRDSEAVKREVEICDQRFSRLAQSSSAVYHLRYNDYVRNHSLIKGLFHFLDAPYNAAELEKIFAKPLNHARSDQTENEQ